eukprot:TRINITY_DN19578_c0_g1_i1.p2 TRINITY_DN19578_c0_g1~~TRINITY_DN19578_c0_g1_i1.p2  ORF type:complete len:141 (+),score=72.41 TRINITY_DN19578_c0_g1_i1:47-469(+)
MIRPPPRSTLSSSSAASDVYKRQAENSGARLYAMHAKYESNVQHKRAEMLELKRKSIAEMEDGPEKEALTKVLEEEANSLQANTSTPARSRTTPQPAIAVLNETPQEAKLDLQGEEEDDDDDEEEEAAFGNSAADDEDEL